MKAALILACVLAVACSRHKATTAGESVDAKVCAGCHADIAKTYSLTGMARSFYPVSTIPSDATYRHDASQTSFQMLRRDGAVFLRHWQTGSGGCEDSVEELKVDYVMGSGNHVRTYLHRSQRGTLVELPLAWYAGNGGHWAMNPGYDAVTWPSRRKIGYDCMFCHNAIPSIPAGHEDPGAEPMFSGALPEGIDCQRCHGTGGEHVRLAMAPGVKPEEVAAAIVNPKRLSPERSMEVCMQCHLETTSFSLPNAIRRFDRGPFSYRPGEPLKQFILFFDHARGTGHEDKFEIVSSAYRLRMSQCFLKSKGALTCTTCHNPHSVPRGADAAAHYNGVCRNCHGKGIDLLVAGKRHTSDANCIMCHMPKRRTEDVVHAVMTDHHIQRNIPVHPLAELAEKHGSAAEYRGEVVPYGAADDLYTAVAQVSAKSNLVNGIPRLVDAIAKERPQRAEFYLELGDAWKNNGKPAEALAPYEEALKRRPGSALIMRRLAEALKESGNPQKAAAVLQQGTQAEPQNAEAWYDLGLLKSDLSALAKAVELDPELAEAHNSLGAIYAEKGSTVEAEAAFRRALQVEPTSAGAHANLANLLSVRPHPAEAAWHFEQAVRLAPASALYRFNYAVTLVRMSRMDDAQRQLKAAIQSDPAFAEPHDLLGGLLEQRGRANEALQEYRRAVELRPGFGKARIDLGTILANTGDAKGAAEQFRKAATDADPAIRQQAEQYLAQLTSR
jgi:predicted CXXCH cytochrome family protein